LPSLEKGHIVFLIMLLAGQLQLSLSASLLLAGLLLRARAR
jgi:hypothetical protein